MGQPVVKTHGGVVLRPVTRANWLACVDLRVRPEQDDFIAANVFSLAQCLVEPSFVPLAVYAGDAMVGFVMYGPDTGPEPQRDAWVIYRLMIDRDHQRRGYGRAALQEVLRRLDAAARCRPVLIGCAPANRAAYHLYTELGFQDTGRRWEDEVVLGRPVSEPSARSHGRSQA